MPRLLEVDIQAGGALRRCDFLRVVNPPPGSIVEFRIPVEDPWGGGDVNTQVVPSRAGGRAYEGGARRAP